MNKRAVFFCLALTFLLANILLVNAAQTIPVINTSKETEQVNKAYNWLATAVRDKWEPMSPEDISFSMLALSFDDSMATVARDVLLSKSSDGKCWPKGACKIKDTAIALLALSRIGYDTSLPEEWLSQQNGTPSELTWYLQIDSTKEAKCTLEYSDRGYNATLDTEKRMDKAAGSCLLLSYGNYWYKISSACYDKTFNIKCDADFVASLFYQKPGANTIYVSSDTKKESAKGSVDLRINAVCLKSAGACDYEGTAWASVALVKKQSIATFIPYLVGYADKNTRYMPNAFLYLLTGQEDYAKALLETQKRAGYWQADSAYDKYYDTALATFALQSYSDEKKTIAKNWLLNEQVKSGTDEGSWSSNKKDTSFVLYSLWEKEASYLPPSNELKCLDYNYYCLPSYQCRLDDTLRDYTCIGTQVCCRKKMDEPDRTCNEMGGVICDMEQQCTGSVRSAKDGSCCLGTCEKPEVNECEDRGYSCRGFCDEKTEEDKGYECPSNMACCGEKGVGPAKGKSLAWLWILLLLLIIGGAAAYYYFFMGGKKGGKKTPPKPFYMPPATPHLERRLISHTSPPAARPNVLASAMRAGLPFTLKKSKTNKQVEDTLSRLKKITEGK